MPGIVARITRAIIERSLCVDCIAKSVEVSPLTVRQHIDRMNELMRLSRREDDRCRDCRAIRETFTVMRRD